jgi:hypothetical protein
MDLTRTKDVFSIKADTDNNADTLKIMSKSGQTDHLIATYVFCIHFDWNAYTKPFQAGTGNPFQCSFDPKYTAYEVKIQ